MKAFLARARAVSEKDLGPLAVELASFVLEQSKVFRSSSERAQRARLSRLLGSPTTQRLGLIITDRAHRSADATRTVLGVREALGRLAGKADLGLVDRFELGALRTLGSIAPPMTLAALHARLKQESEAFALDADRLGPGLSRLKELERRINLNQLGEEVLGEKDAARYVATTVGLLGREDVDAVSIKLSSLYSQARVVAFDSVVQVGLGKVAPIFEAAMRSDKLVYFDMEAFRDLELSAEIFLRSVLAPRFAQVRSGIALQAYLPDTLELLERILLAAHRRIRSGGRRLRVRLVKGANLAAETVQASLSRLEVPIFSDKHQVDAHLKRILRQAFRPEHLDAIELGLGSHNIFDQAYAVLLAEQRGVRSMLELEMLYGMTESVGTAWSRLDRPVLVYAPAVSAASFPAAVAYLVRRLDENTSPENFLASSLDMEAGDAAFEREALRFLDALDTSYEPAVETRRTQDRGHLYWLSGPAPALSPGDAPAEAAFSPLAAASSLSERFDNASDTDWTRPWNREALTRALDWARASEFLVGPRIGGEFRVGPETSGFDPSEPDQAAYRLHLATAHDIERALSTATEALPRWSQTEPKERALILERAAIELEKDRLRLIALMVKDAGKRVEEADIEVSEAVDFARYYARSLLELDERYELTARGVTVVTPPWNFPLAIPLGGCLAALAAGNTVILKPAPETPLVAQAGVEALFRAGVPLDALSFIPCDDSIASPLIQDSRVCQVVLTGATSTAQLFLKLRPSLRLIAETGGKNAAFVSALSDREAAIHAIVQSAFGHAGQKCSALSVLVLEKEVYEDAHFRAALIDAAASLPVGSAWQVDSFVTPLIRPPVGPLAQVLERGDGRARWVLSPQIAPKNRALVSPGILWGVLEGSFAHTTEFFGPVLSVLPARNLEQGLTIMNATPYGLTAGFFGLSEGEQTRFAETVDAGNLYINRSLTGAVVGRQPFGGRKASSFGPGAKAGGPRYVGQLAKLRLKPSGLARGPASNFPAEARGTAAVGEANWLRFQAARTILIVGAGTTEAEVSLTLAAARSVGAKIDRYPGASGSEHAPLHAAATLTRFVEASKARRVRLLGEAPLEVGLVAAELGLTLLDDPVSEDLELERQHYLLEQSVSVAFHRYGNISLRDLHPMLQGR